MPLKVGIGGGNDRRPIPTSQGWYGRQDFLLRRDFGTARAAESQQSKCVAAAFTEYKEVNADFILRAIPMPVENVLAQRRLQEQYCLQYARCMIGDPSVVRSLNSPFSVAFSTCLREEAAKGQ